MIFTIIIIPALALLICLINAEKTNSTKKILLYKTPLSLLFILAWGLQPAQNALFSKLVLIALLFCLAGDILLAFPSRSAFFSGLVSFLLGHVIYAAAFFLFGVVGQTMAVGVVLLTVSAAVVWRWLVPHLSTMQVPVLAYIVVISIMVAGAFGVYGNSNLPEGVRRTIFFGAVFFYLSDFFVARERFIVNTHMNQAVGLPMYYTAQFLLAFSAAWIPG